MSNERRIDSHASRNDNGKRRLSRRSVSPVTPRSLTNDDGNAAAVTISKKMRTSLRNLKCCCDIDGIPNEYKCDGCARWDSSRKLKPRDQMKTREYKCQKVWQCKEEDVPDRLHRHCEQLIKFVESTKSIDRSALVDDTTTTNNNNDDDNDEVPGPIEVHDTPSPPQRNVNFTLCEFTSQGQDFSFLIPNSHCVEHTSDVKRWKNGYDCCERIRKKFRKKLHRTDCMFSQALWAIATCAVPALALSAAQFLFPLIVLAFLHDTGIFENGVPADTHPRCFPSDAALRKHVITQAVRDTTTLGKMLLNVPMYIACDKGNKRGISHFVKHLCWWCRIAGQVRAQALDIDASGGTTQECADAIEASMNKLKAVAGAATHLLAGQGTDSGGGGVLDGLADALQAKINLCVDVNDYLVANCCIHALQLQLRNAVVAVFGEGGLDKTNMMQMLHSVCDLQEAIEANEWRHMLWKSSEFVHSFDPSIIIMDEQAIDVLPARAKCQNEFHQACNKIVGFHSKFNKAAPTDPESLSQCKDTIYAKVAAPILTRWWTVGAGASYLFECCLQLCHACQAIINTHPGDSKANKIASGLFSLMTDHQNFIDMALVRCFNKAYVHPHLRWLQACTDFTNRHGFQSHNIAIRHFLMHRDLSGVTGRQMDDYHEAIEENDPEGTHFAKLELFVKASQDSLQKHFSRWMTPKMLPSALLSEPPLAKVVASVMLKADAPSNAALAPEVLPHPIAGEMQFMSAAHGRVINVKALDRFIRQNVDDDAEHAAADQQAADALLQGLNLRDKDYTNNHGDIRLRMHRKCPPCPSQTQFVESGVKDAKNVSSTDRSEQVRTCMSVTRSVTPLTKSSEDGNATKINAIIGSAVERINPHVGDMCNAEHKQTFNSVEHAMTKAGHFQQQRINNKIATFDNQRETCKRQNVAQQVKPQQQTPAVTGLIPLGKIFQTKEGHMQGLQVELCHRGVPIVEVQRMKITERKNKLKELETNRLVEEETMTPQAAAERAKKYFKRLSTAEFQFVGEHMHVVAPKFKTNLTKNQSLFIAQTEHKAFHDG